MGGPPESGRKTKGVKRLGSLLLRSLGVPKPAADRLAGPALAVIASVFFLVGIIIFALVGGAVSSVVVEEEQLRAATAAEYPEDAFFGSGTPPIPPSLARAYWDATEGTRVPWTLLAALGEVMTGNGRGIPSSELGAAGLATSDGFIPPASGKTLLILDAASAEDDIEPYLSSVGDGSVSTRTVGSIGEVPAVAHGSDLSAGDLLVVIAPEATRSASPSEVKDAAARTAMSLPQTVTIVWAEVDVPDWQEVTEVVCSAEELPAEPGYPYMPGPQPGSPPPLLDLPELPEGEEWGKRGLPPICVTRTRMEIVSERNLAEPQNKAVKGISSRPRFSTADISGPYSAGQRPGPSLAYSDPLAVNGAAGNRGRMAGVVGPAENMRSLYLGEPHDTDCPIIDVTTSNGGSGVFGMHPARLAEFGIQPPAYRGNAIPWNLADVCVSARLMVEVILAAADSYSDTENTSLLGLIRVAVAKERREEVLRGVAQEEVWAQVLSRVASVTTAPGDPCLSLVANSTPSHPVHQVVSSIWDCVIENEAPALWSVAEGMAGGDLLARTISNEQARIRAMSEALEVSWRYSGLEPCRLFPMTDEQFSEFAPPGSDRCSPAAESYAAAKMFSASASSYSPEAGHEASWGLLTAGWHAFPDVVGSQTSSAAFRELGPARERNYPQSCVSFATRTLSSAASPLLGSYTISDMEWLLSGQTGSSVVEDTMLAPAREAMRQVASAIRESDECGPLMARSGEEYVVLSLSALRTYFYDDTAAPERASTDPSVPSLENMMHFLSRLAFSSSASAPDLAQDAPLLRAVSADPLPPYLGPEPSPVRERGRLVSSALAAVYAQAPGLVRGTRWDISGSSPVGPDVPYSEVFNSVAASVDPRLMLAVARFSGPLDPTRNCSSGVPPFGLFGLQDADKGCSDPLRQASYAASELERLAADAGGRVQGAVYAFQYNDPSLASLWAEARGDMEDFARMSGRDLLDLGASRDGRSIMALWYDSMLMFPGDQGYAMPSLAYGLFAGAPLSCEVPGRTYNLGIGFPLQDGAYVSSPYGNRFHPIHRRNILHAGVDMSLPGGSMGAPIFAAAPGTVVVARRMEGYGNTVDIAHAGGILTRYAHLSAYTVQRGDVVSGGQRIGCVGMTGTATAPHLHFEIHVSGVPQNPCTRALWC